MEIPGPSKPWGPASVCAVVVCALVSSIPSTLRAESFFSQFKDDDGWFDICDWVLDNTAGFMPVPVIITEPAVDGGLGVAAAFFHPPDDYAAETFAEDTASGEDEFVVPDVTAIVGAYTGNDSWLVGGGHFAHWMEDRIRYEGVIGYASINLKYFGQAGGSEQDAGIQFTSEGPFAYQPFRFRWRHSSLFLGAAYEYANVNVSIDLGTGIPEIDPLSLDVNLSGIDLLILYDSLDNDFTPNSGVEAEITLGRKDEAIGSDLEYTEFKAKLHTFWTIGSNIVLGTRLDLQAVTGDAPFIELPYINMRGIPAIRYQGESVALAEVEARWSVHPRIGLVGFLGLGMAAKSASDLGTAPSRVARGGGIRYHVARKLGMHVGIDVADGPEDTHWYLTLGQAW